MRFLVASVVARNLGFRHSRKWASPVCHQIIRFRCFAIMKRGHSAALPFHPFSIHFSFSYLFFDRMFPNYPWLLDGLILCFSHERELPTHPVPDAAGPRPTSFVTMVDPAPPLAACGPTTRSRPGARLAPPAPSSLSSRIEQEPIAGAGAGLRTRRSAGSHARHLSHLRQLPRRPQPSLRSHMPRLPPGSPRQRPPPHLSPRRGAAARGGGGSAGAGGPQLLS